jgi:hypothetical protein
MRIAVRVTCLALVTVTAACRREPLITTRLVDGRASPASNGWPLFLVEVHRNGLAPFQGMDRLWKRFERVDTVPYVRSLGAVAVLGDTMVIGVGGFSNTAFQYDLRTKALTRSPQPAWLDSGAYTPPASLAPQGQYIVYLANQADGMTRLAVRSWPDGRVAAQSPPIHLRTFFGPERGGAIWWQNAESFYARFPVSDSGPSWASVNGRVGSRGVELDWKIYPDLNPQTVAEPPRPVAPVDPATDTARWARAEREIVQLPLSKFPELPAAFVRELEGCTVPQTYVTSRPHNVIHGTFASSRQLDWAVLCSRGGESVIRIFWGGPVHCPRELQAAANRGYLQGIGEGKIGFSRYIGMTDFYRNYGDESDTATTIGERTVKLEHDAIEDSFAEKGSTIWLCRNGRWISFSGAD